MARRNIDPAQYTEGQPVLINPQWGAWHPGTFVGIARGGRPVVRLDRTGLCDIIAPLYVKPRPADWVSHSNPHPKKELVCV